MYNALGRREDALATTEQAVSFWQRLVETSPMPFLTRFAKSLDNLARILRENDLSPESHPTMMAATALLIRQEAALGLDRDRQAPRQSQNNQPE